MLQATRYFLVEETKCNLNMTPAECCRQEVRTDLSRCASVYDNNIRMMLSLMLTNDCIYLELPSL